MVIVHELLAKKDVLTNTSTSHESSLSFVDDMENDGLKLISHDFGDAFIESVTTVYRFIIFIERKVKNFRHKSKGSTINLF